MQQFIEFSLRHWELWLAFFIILAVLLATELHSKFRGLKAISPQEAIFAINRANAVVVDVRSNEVFAQGHIVGAINIPLTELDTQLGKIQKFKENPIIIVTTGNQTLTKIDALLENNGFGEVCCINGGMAAWQAAGLPLAKGK